MNVLKSMVVVGAMVFVGGCATSFTGSAYVESGRSGCDTKCKAAGFECVGMVYMGEYSDACVCGAPGRAASAPSLGLASVAAGAAGVVMQMRQQQAQQNAANAHNY
jgi:hypothetical protein